MAAVHFCDFAVAVDDGGSFAECNRLSGLALGGKGCFLEGLVRLCRRTLLRKMKANEGAEGVCKFRRGRMEEQDQLTLSDMIAVSHWMWFTAV